MAGQGRPKLPAPSPAPVGEANPPATLMEYLKELRDAARAAGELLDDPGKVTLGEIKLRGGKLVKLLGCVK